VEFTVVRSDNPDDYFAPWQVWLDGEMFLDGIELQQEAISICEVLRLVPPRAPHPQNIFVLKPPHKRPKFVPKKIEGWKLTETRKLLNEQPKPRT
jgi:hypothetical protein